MKQKLSRNIDLILVLAIFLPYIPNGYGLRVEHLMVYAIFFILLFGGRITKTRLFAFSSILILYTTLFIHVLISSVINQVQIDINFIANFENYFETLVLFLILNSLVLQKGYFTKERMLKLNRFFHILLALNTVLILFEIFTPYADSVISYYIKGGGDGFREGTNSMGRYTGVFDIVFAGGFAYSLGLLTWVYNFFNYKKNVLHEVILLILILIGGFASVSKVFFIGGILVSAYLFVRIGNIKPKISLALFGSIILAFITPYFINDWKGFGLFEGYFSGLLEGSTVEVLSSGRLGSEEGIYSLALNSEMSIFFGNGLTMGLLPFFDSEHVQLYFQGGLVAIIIYIIIYLKTIRFSQSLDKVFSKEKLLIQCVIVLGIFTAFGGPVFFMNRVRIFFFLQLFFLYRLSLITRKSVPT